MAGVNGRPALVRNAADPRQVKRAEQEERRRDNRLANLTRQLLSNPDFREWVTSVTDYLGVDSPIWDSSSRIHYLEGRRQAGLEIRGMCQVADPELAAQGEMEKIRRALSAQRTVAAIAAGQTSDEDSAS